MIAVHYAGMLCMNRFLSGSVVLLQPESKPCYSLVLAGIAAHTMPASGCSAMSRHDGDTLRVHSVL